MSKAKIQTIRVTGVLVVGFIICWTPYNVMSLWWWIDRGSAAQTDFRLQKLLWTAAAMNNCINPLLYRMSFSRRLIDKVVVKVQVHVKQNI